MYAQDIDQTMAKLKKLPPERIAEVDDFIDCLSQRDSDAAITHAAKMASEPGLQQIWDNEADAEYDHL